MRMIIDIDYKHALDIIRQVQDIKGVKSVKIKYNSNGSFFDRLRRR